MKHLIVFAHPNPKSFNRAILDTYTGALKESGHEVRIRDLYAMDFPPVLSADDLAGVSQGKIAKEVREEQQHVAWADRITFIYPLWWCGMPAIAKGYIDRVFAEGFAYAFDANGLKKLLTGKQVMTIVTLGDSEENYRNKGFFAAMDQLMDGVTFEFPGLTVVGHKYFGSVPIASDADRKRMLSEVRNWGHTTKP
ncbi:MAG: NAD(P)H-dependent oxidoreductase [Pseudomonadota bacterium]